MRPQPILMFGVLLLGSLFFTGCGAKSQPDSVQTYELGALTCPSDICSKPQPDAAGFTDCAATTLRTAEDLRALVTADLTTPQLCSAAGLPDWVTGSGLAIYIYQLEDGSSAWFGFAGEQHLMYARKVNQDGTTIEWLP